MFDSDSDTLSPPSPNGRNGRGQFAAGNAGGPGNPHGAQAARLRKAMFDAVTPDDMTAIIRKMVEQAKRGDLAAIRELLLRTLGRPLEADVLERLDALERDIAQASTRGDCS